MRQCQFREWVDLASVCNFEIELIFFHYLFVHCVSGNNSMVEERM
jgi:hypothetical protein